MQQLLQALRKASPTIPDILTQKLANASEEYAKAVRELKYFFQVYLRRTRLRHFSDITSASSYICSARFFIARATSRCCSILWKITVALIMGVEGSSGLLFLAPFTAASCSAFKRTRDRRLFKAWRDV